MGNYAIIPRTQICKSVGVDARLGGMLNIRECIKGRYVIISRTQICIAGVQDGEVCLALGSV